MDRGHRLRKRGQGRGVGGCTWPLSRRSLAPGEDWKERLGDRAGEIHRRDCGEEIGWDAQGVDGVGGMGRMIHKDQGDERDREYHFSD